MYSVVQNVLRALKRLMHSDVYYQVLEGPGEGAFVEMVEHGMFFKTYTPVCFATKSQAYAIVERNNSFLKQVNSQ